jgi:hypothetical protein
MKILIAKTIKVNIAKENQKNFETQKGHFY